MADNVIDLDQYRVEGNGSREVLIDHMAYYAKDERDLEEICDFVDALLARLWMAGYKIVPLTEDDHASDPEVYA